jgi:hypothetical protein
MPVFPGMAGNKYDLSNYDTGSASAGMTIQTWQLNDFVTIFGYHRKKYKTSVCFFEPIRSRQTAK